MRQPRCASNSRARRLDILRALNRDSGRGQWPVPVVRFVRDADFGERRPLRGRRITSRAKLAGFPRLVTARSVPGRTDSVEYLLVDDDGRILAVLSSVKEVPLELARIGRDRKAVGPVRVVRHDEHGDNVVGASSLVTATSLSSLLRRSRSR